MAASNSTKSLRDVLASLLMQQEMQGGGNLPDITDPSSPGYSRRHGGSFATGAIDSAASGVTLPGDVYRGEVGDPMTDDAAMQRILDLAGTASLGSAPFGPPGALRSGAALPQGKGADKALLRELLENAPDPKAKHKHLAERYPEVGPPVMKPKDDGSGRMFPSKQRTAEENALMKDRLAIQKQMDAEGFEPYFDPAQRADVDPSFYPTGQNTLRDVVGAKPETRAKHEAIATNPEGMARLRAAFERGREMPGAENWYFMKQLEDEFIAEYGEELGRAAFKDRFAGGMAATTGGMDPMNNLMLSQYGAFNKTHGIPLPEAGHQIPSPMGGPYVHGNLKQYYRFNDAGGGALDMDAMGNPKRHDFQYNFLGHGDKATIDEQMTELITGKPGAPPAGNYGSYELPVHQLAQEYGVDPRYFQEVAWAGGKQLKNEARKNGRLSHHEGGKPMIQFVNEAIERTHRLTGMPRKEIVRRALVRGEIPLYQGGGELLAGMHGLAGDEPSEY